MSFSNILTSKNRRNKPRLAKWEILIVVVVVVYFLYQVLDFTHSVTLILLYLQLWKFVRDGLLLLVAFQVYLIITQTTKKPYTWTPLCPLITSTWWVDNLPVLFSKNESHENLSLVNLSETCKIHFQFPSKSVNDCRIHRVWAVSIFTGSGCRSFD